MIDLIPNFMIDLLENIINSSHRSRDLWNKKTKKGEK